MNTRRSQFIYIALLMFLLTLAMLPLSVAGQDADPPTNEPVPSPTAGQTTQPTVVGPTPTTNPPIAQPPVPIPEPVTVVLFGTGLAALSAAVAARRKKED